MSASRNIALSLIVIGVVALGYWLRPRPAFELWRAASLPQPTGLAAQGWRLGDPGFRSGGLALVDVDGDGRDDIVVSRVAERGLPGLVVWRNLGAQRFEPWNEDPVLGSVGGACYGMGVGDFDGDGRDDFYVARRGSDALLLHRADGFEDVSAASGVEAATRDWHVGVSVADFDRDGRLDVFACRLGGASRVEDARAEDGAPVVLGRVLLQRAPGLFDVVVLRRARRDGDGSSPGCLTATAVDLDGDGAIDLQLLDEAGGRWLCRGDGHGAFGPVEVLGGSQATADESVPQGSGADFGDLDGDGRVEWVAVDPTDGESLECLKRSGEEFLNVAGVCGLDVPRRAGTRSVHVIDLDNDGDLDVFAPGGRSRVFLNRGGGAFHEPGELFGDMVSTELARRGSACADLDGDGRVDVVTAASPRAPVVYWSRLDRRHWIRLRLRSVPGLAPASPPGGVGARVEVRVGDVTRMRIVRRGGGGYLSSGSGVLHVGLGDATHVDGVKIVWPSGVVDEQAGVEADREYLAGEGEPGLSVVGPPGLPRAP